MEIRRWLKRVAGIAIPVLAVMAILFVVLRTGVEDAPPPLVSLKSYQDADAPLVATGAAYDPRFHRLTAFERAELAPAHHWSLAARAGDGGVRAVANGRVVAAGADDGFGGETVIVVHRTPNGKLVRSVYGGLSDVQVRRGARVSRGQSLGRATEEQFQLRLEEGDSAASEAPERDESLRETVRRWGGRAAKADEPEPLRILREESTAAPPSLRTGD